MQNPCLCLQNGLFLPFGLYGKNLTLLVCGEGVVRDTTFGGGAKFFLL
jgi:hypothetical protein